MQLTEGSVVKSTAGHDAGSYGVVIGFQKAGRLWQTENTACWSVQNAKTLNTLLFCGKLLY